MEPGNSKLRLIVFANIYWIIGMSQYLSADFAVFPRNVGREYSGPNGLDRKNKWSNCFSTKFPDT